MSGPLIEFKQVGKRFHRHEGEPTLSWKQLFMRGFRVRKKRSFWALRDLTLKVDSGEMLGVIGRNGAGKSTLVKLMGKVLTPEEGTIRVTGRVGALYDLSAGFHPDLSGRENLNTVGLLSGYDSRELRNRIGLIIEFAELEDVVDELFRTYSSGMRMRLAFSLAIHLDPKVILVDEVLSVGDVRFRLKCLSRINELKNAGSSVVLVSHDVAQVQRYCDRCLWLEEGRQKSEGVSSVVVREYLKEQTSTEENEIRVVQPPLQMGSASNKDDGEQSSDQTEVRIDRVLILDETGNEITALTSGEMVVFSICYKEFVTVDTIFSITISSVDGDVLTRFNTRSSSYVVPRSSGMHMSIELVVDRLELAAGNYYVSAGCYSPDWQQKYDYRWQCALFSVNGSYPGAGPWLPKHRWRTAMVDEL